MLPYFGLAAGFLTGKYRSADDLGKSVRGHRMKTYLDERGQRVLAALDEVAGETGTSPAQVALAWLAAQPGVTAPIASATSVAQLDELLGVLTLDLGPAQIERLSAASAVSVAEVAHAGEDHRQPGFVGGGDHFLVADRAAGLDHRGRARLGGGEQAVGEGEEGVRGDRRADRARLRPAGLLGRVLGLPGGDPRRIRAGSSGRRRCRRWRRPWHRRSRST